MDIYNAAAAVLGITSTDASLCLLAGLPASAYEDENVERGGGAGQGQAACRPQLERQ
jgi:hypothetical protein